jgi:hypothetical protein
MIIKRSIRFTVTVAVIIIGAMDAMAIEEAKYTVLEKDNRFEIRNQRTKKSPCVRFRLDGWLQCAIQVFGAKSAILNTNLNWSPGFTKEA